MNPGTYKVLQWATPCRRGRRYADPFFPCTLAECRTADREEARLAVIVVSLALGAIGWMVIRAFEGTPYPVRPVTEPTRSAPVGTPTAARVSTPSATTDPTITSVLTQAGRLRVGDTCDDALSKVNSGRRVSLTKDGADRFVDTRLLGGFTYALVFGRPTGSIYIGTTSGTRPRADGSKRRWMFGRSSTCSGTPR